MDSNFTSDNWDLWDENMILIDCDQLEMEIQPDRTRLSSGVENGGKGFHQDNDIVSADLKLLLGSMEKVSEMLNNLETEQIKFWNTFNQCATENEHLQFKLSRCSRKLDNLLKDIDSSKAANLEMAATGDHVNNMNPYMMCIQAARIDGEGLLAPVQPTDDGVGGDSGSGEMLSRIDRLKKKMQSKVHEKERKAEMPRQVELPEAGKMTSSIHSSAKEMQL